MLDGASKRRIHDVLVAARLARHAAADPLHGPRCAPATGIELFEVCLGLQLRPGKGPDRDDLIADECAPALAVAAGADPRSWVRQARAARRSPCACGRPESACPAWPEGMMPLGPALPGGGVFAVAPGMALVRSRRSGDGITVAAASLAHAEGRDFRFGLELAARPGRELALLAVLLERDGRGEPDRARALAERHSVAYAEVDGADVESCWHGVGEAIARVRHERRPALLVARNRSSGMRVAPGSAACVVRPPGHVAATFGERLVVEAVLSMAECGTVWEQWSSYLEPCQEHVRITIDGSRL